MIVNYIDRCECTVNDMVKLVIYRACASLQYRKFRARLGSGPRRGSVRVRSTASFQW